MDRKSTEISLRHKKRKTAVSRKNAQKLNDPLDAFENTELIREAQSGNWDKVRELLRKGANARQKNIFGINAHGMNTIVSFFLFMRTVFRMFWGGTSLRAM